MLTIHYDSVSPACQGCLDLPAQPLTAHTPKALLIHGGGWSSLDRHSFDGVAQFFHDLGFITFNIDYRLTPEAPWPACGDDCLTAARKLIDGELPGIAATAGNPILVCGASSGGHLALMTGLRLPAEQVLGTISISGIADPVPDQAVYPDRYQLLFANGPLDPKAFPLEFLSPHISPVLVTHYLHDPVVPFDSVMNFVLKGRQLQAPIQTYFYNLGRANQGHAIWIENSSPHKLFPDIEKAIREFIEPLIH